MTTIAPNIASPTSPRKLSSSQVDMAPISKDPTRDKSRSPTILLHLVNMISITRERIYVFLLELAAALVWNRTSLIILLPFSFLLVYPPGLSHTAKVKRPRLCAHNVYPLPTQLLYPTKPSIVVFSVLKIRWQSSNTYYEKLMSHLANST
jgi:hypothetical protein